MDWFLKKTDWYLTGAVALLLLLSSSILYSLSVNNPDNLSWFYRQLVWIGVGVVCFIVFSLIVAAILGLFDFFFLELVGKFLLK